MIPVLGHFHVKGVNVSMNVLTCLYFQKKIIGYTAYNSRCDRFVIC